MASTEEIQKYIIEPMRALYRVPFGIEDPERALVEYTKALKSIPGNSLEGGWSRIIATHKKRDWPTISELITEIGRAEAVVVALKSNPEDAGKVHAARVNPAPELRGAMLLDAAIRQFPEWEAFLEKIHPTIEHNFFVQAEKTTNGIEVPNDFRREYIVTNYSEAMKSHFGKAVVVSVNKQRHFKQLPASYGAN